MLYVHELMKLKSMEGAELAGGKTGVNNIVRDIMVMEAPDIEHWMVKGQLLLTSLFGMGSYKEEEIEEFVRRVAEHKGAGIIVKVKRFVDEIPQSMIRACDQQAVPLIRIPLEHMYSDIMIEVMQILFNNKVYMLDFYHQVHMRFTQLSLNKPSFLQVLNLLESFIDNPVSLINRQGELICTTDPEYAHGTFIRNQNLQKEGYMSYSYTKQLVKVSEKSDQLCSVIKGQIPNIGNDYHYLLVAEKNKPVAAMDYMAMDNAISFLQMELIKQFAIMEQHQNYLNDMIDDLMTGKIGSREKTQEAMESLRLSMDEEYRFVVVQLLPKDITWDETENKKQLQRFVDNFMLQWKHAIYRIRSERIIFILRATEDDLPTFKNKIQKAVLQVLHNNFSNTFEHYIGIGERCHVNAFKKCSIQVLKAMQLTSNINKNGSFVICLEELGFYRFLMDISDDIQLLELVPAPIKTLLYKSPDLMETFETFLDTGQNLTKSADILHVHPKTMRYRVDKIQTITGVDLENPEELLQYNIGFRVLRMLKQMKMDAP